jgi:hypothetical protein
MTAKLNILRALAQEAAVHPAIQGAVNNALMQTLPTVIEGILCKLYPGETVRLYVRKRPDQDQRAMRDERIRAAAAEGTPKGLIADREGITLRQVQRVLAGVKENA